MNDVVISAKASTALSGRAPQEDGPTIVAVAYNRPESLYRLLGSLDRAVYERATRLIISIDQGSNEDVQKVANGFEWRHGEKRVIYQNVNLGLREHILKCGDLTEQYGSVIVLEDDLYVSPAFHAYATRALRFYANKPEIAGISLYSHHINHNAVLPFEPLADESDVYFAHWASSWGQAWDLAQWRAFREWYANNTGPLTMDEPAPMAILRWPKSSWLKYFIKYCTVMDRFVVYPRESYATNFGDAGTHAPRASTLPQSALQLFKSDVRLKDLADSNAVYDAWFEMAPDRLKRLVGSLRELDFEVDLYGTKRFLDIQRNVGGESGRAEAGTHGAVHLASFNRNQEAQIHASGDAEKYVLTTRQCASAKRTFALAMEPMPMNVIHEIPGNGISLCRAADVDWESGEANKRLYEYFYPELGVKRLISNAWTRVGRKLLRRIKGE